LILISQKCCDVRLAPSSELFYLRLDWMASSPVFDKFFPLDEVPDVFTTEWAGIIMVLQFFVHKTAMEMIVHLEALLGRESMPTELTCPLWSDETFPYRFMGAARLAT